MSVTKSHLASLSFIGQATKLITLKWPVVVLELLCVFVLVDIDFHRVYP